MFFIVDPKRCKRDGICVEACGRGLIELKDRESLPLPVFGGEKLCLNCGHCMAACPTGALVLNNVVPEDCPEIRKDLLVTVEQIEQFFGSRRSIRGYRDKPVEREKINKLITLAGYAPSARNARPVNLLISDGTAEVKRLAGLVMDWIRLVREEAPAWAEPLRLDRVVELWDQGKDPILRHAPLLIIAHAHEGFTMGREDCILALAYMELAASPLGLGATWAGYFLTATRLYPPLTEALALPAGHKCFGALMVGYPRLKFVRLPLRKPPPVTWKTSR